MDTNSRHDTTESPLGRYWDGIVQGRAADATDLDPTLVATVRHLHAQADMLGADRQFADRLLEELMHATTPRDSSAFALIPVRPPVRAGRAVSPVPPLAPSPSRWALTQLATAALVLLALVATFVVVARGRYSESDTPVFLPAIGGTPAASAAVPTETLFDLTVDALPSGWGSVGVLRWTLQPGPQPLHIAPQDGPRFVLVESGEVTATEAGIAHRLGPGDVFVTADPEQEVAIRVRGTEDVSLLEGSVTNARRDEVWVPEVHTFVFLLEGISEELPGGAGHLVLEQLTLPPGETLPPLEAKFLVWIDLGEGTLGLTLDGDEMPLGWTAGEEQTVLPVDGFPQQIPPGTRMTLRSAGDDPLVLYRLTLTPSAAGTAGTATPTP